MRGACCNHTPVAVHFQDRLFHQPVTLASLGQSLGGGRSRSTEHLQGIVGGGDKKLVTAILLYQRTKLKIDQSVTS